jgi:hypothetical protein
MILDHALPVLLPIGLGIVLTVMDIAMCLS